MIKLESKTLTAHIIPYGATLAGLWHRDTANSLVLGSPEADAYADALSYCGAIVGPVANRIARAKIDVGGSQWSMQANEGENCLHSGSSGVHAKDWRVSDLSATSVTLTLQLPHGDGGLPGNRSLIARYQVTDTSFLNLAMRVYSDADTAINLAHHPYWNLDSSATISDHLLQVHAERYLPVNAQLLPTGQIASVGGSRYDFRSPRAVPTNFALDNNFCLSEKSLKIPELAATLTGSSGVAMRIETTEPGLQVYNGSGLGAVSWPMHDSRKLQPHAGIALEPQGWPAAPHHPRFPQIWLRAGETYRQETRYHIS